MQDSNASANVSYASHFDQDVRMRRSVKAPYVGDILLLHLLSPAEQGGDRAGRAGLRSDAHHHTCDGFTRVKAAWIHFSNVNQGAEATL